jgi:hypothetical protein
MMNPIAIVLTVILSILMLTLPRRYAALPLVLAACLLTIEQKIIVLGFNFTVVRIVMLAGWVRVLLRSETAVNGPHRIDAALVLWVISMVVVYTVLWHSPAAFVNRLGHAYDALGLYFLFRCLFREIADIMPVVTMVAVMAGVLGGVMLYEYVTGTNVFAAFGGVQAEAWVRGSHVRAQGPFRQPILAGSFAATALPVFVALWFGGGWRRAWATIGITGAALIVFSTSSSGPLLASIFGTGAVAFWFMRNHLRAIRWSIVGILVALAVAMKAPVWYLFAKIGAVVGGGGWHRSYLIEQAFSHLNEWWLIGTTYTAHWMPYALDERSADITNQYLVEGVNGGLVTMVLFIILVIRGFQGVGTALRGMQDLALHERLIVWSMGAALLGHAVSFLSVSYFDQIIVFWYMLLAMIAGAVSQASIMTAAVPAPIPPATDGLLRDAPALSIVNQSQGGGVV